MPRIFNQPVMPQERLINIQISKPLSEIAKLKSVNNIEKSTTTGGNKDIAIKFNENVEQLYYNTTSGSSLLFGSQEAASAARDLEQKPAILNNNETSPKKSILKSVSVYDKIIVVNNPDLTDARSKNL